MWTCGSLCTRTGGREESEAGTPRTRQMSCCMAWMVLSSNLFLHIMVYPNINQTSLGYRGLVFPGEVVRLVEQMAKETCVLYHLLCSVFVLLRMFFILFFIFTLVSVFLQKELVQMQAAVQMRLKDTKEDLKEMSLTALQHKVSLVCFCTRPPVSL